MSSESLAAPSPARGVRSLDAHVWRIATVVILGSIMSVLDSTITNIALESLSRDLHAQLSEVQWVVTAYLLSLAAVIPVSAWAARRFGAKRLYLLSIVVFTIGSVLCGLATSTQELIFFRVIQGVGGGMIMPVGQMILVRAAGPRNLARVMGVIGIPILLAPVLGPTIGGLLLDNAGWRWIFYVNVPIGIVAVAAGLRKLPTDAREDAGPFDLLGLAMVATGLVAVTYGLAELAIYAFSDVGHVLLPLIAGVVLIAAFVVRALHIKYPLLDVRVYANRAFGSASVTMFCFGGALFGGMILMPLYFQTVRHQDAVITGLLLAPRGIGAAIGTFLGGRATERLGAGVTAAIGGLIALAATLPFVMLGSNTSYVVIGMFLLIGGIGLGLATMQGMTAAYRTLRRSQINDATAQLNILMRVGGSIGTAILTVVLQGHLTKAGSSLAAQAAAFGSTFWWVVGFTAVAVLPTFVLIQAERREPLSSLPEDPEYDAVPVTANMVEAG